MPADLWGKQNQQHTAPIFWGGFPGKARGRAEQLRYRARLQVSSAKLSPPVPACPAQVPRDDVLPLPFALVAALCLAACLPCIGIGRKPTLFFLWGGGHPDADQTARSGCVLTCVKRPKGMGPSDRYGTQDPGTKLGPLVSTGPVPIGGPGVCFFAQWDRGPVGRGPPGPGRHREPRVRRAAPDPSRPKDLVPCHLWDVPGGAIIRLTVCLCRSE